jgi:hypothetical protein
MDFSNALIELKNGELLTRTGWNGRGIFVFLVSGSQFKVNREPLNRIFPEGKEITYRPHIDIKNVDGSIATWVPSIGDLMAEDWAIADAE